LATAAGATVAADQWVIGSPTKDARYKAYTNGIGQLQCVIDDAWGMVPTAPSARKGGKGRDDVDGIIGILGEEEAAVTLQRTALSNVASESAAQCSGDTALLARLIHQDSSIGLTRPQFRVGDARRRGAGGAFLGRIFQRLEVAGMGSMGPLPQGSGGGGAAER
jgi:hypothetical protein